jgi:hypothetical protein
MTKTTMTGFVSRALCASMACGIVMLSGSPLTFATSRASGATADKIAVADGLSPLADSVMAQAWIKPGTDLRKYETLLLLPATVKPFETRGHGSDFPLTDEQLTYVRTVVPAALMESLSDLSDLELTSRRTPKTLVLEIAVVDIVSHLPPQSAGRSATFTRMLGAATLAIELRDATTNVVVARAMERREIARRTVYRSNRAWNQAEVRKAAERFAENVKSQIEEFTEVSARSLAAR